MHNLSKYLNMTAQLVQLLPTANPDPFSLTYLLSTNLSVHWYPSSTIMLLSRIG